MICKRLLCNTSVRRVSPSLHSWGQRDHNTHLLPWPKSLFLIWPLAWKKYQFQIRNPVHDMLLQVIQVSFKWLQCVLWLIHVLHVLRQLPTQPLQGRELGTPVQLSDGEGACSGQSLDLASVASQCQAVGTLSGLTPSICDAKWSENSFLKGGIVLQMGKGLQSFFRGHWSRQTEIKHFLVKSISAVKAGEIVSECITLELFLHKEPALAPWDSQIDHGHSSPERI